MICRYLDGENIAPRTKEEAKKLIGKDVVYLQEADIDRSGRGLFFPKYGKIVAVFNKSIAIDTPDNYVIFIPKLVEMVLDTSNYVNETQDDNIFERVKLAIVCACAVSH